MKSFPDAWSNPTERAPDEFLDTPKDGKALSCATEALLLFALVVV